MLKVLSVTGLPMAPIDRESDEKKSSPTKNIKVRVVDANMLSDIAEAKGLHIWQVVEEMLAADLPATHKAIQPRLKAVRSHKAKMEAEQALARKDGAG